MSEYERLLEEAKIKVEEGRERVRQTAERYIPKLYQALCDEWHTPQQAKKKIYKDCKNLWSKEWIREQLPVECKNQKQAEAAKQTNKTRAAKKARVSHASTPELEEPIAVTTNGHVSGGSGDDTSIADSHDIRLPITLDLRKYYPAIDKCWKTGRHEVTLIHNGNEVIEVDYLD